MAESEPPVTDKPLRVTAENIGGIDHTERELPPGVTILAGENATNRSSFLQAIMAGLGSDRVSLKSDADEGHVTLTVGDTEYTRTLTRSGPNTVVKDGDPYLSTEDAKLADLYAFLVEDNEVRRAIERGDDIYDVLMRPVDKGDIEAQQQRLREQEQELEDQIEAAEQAAEEAIELTEQKTSLEDEIESLNNEIDALEDEIAELEADAKEEDTNEELDKLQEQISELRGEIQAKEDDITEWEAKIQATEAELDSIDLSDIPKEDLEAKKEELEAQEQELYQEIDNLETLRDQIMEAQSVNQAIQEGSFRVDRFLNALDGDVQISEGPLTETDTTGDVTDPLTGDESFLCQACGTVADREHLEAVHQQYQDLNQEFKSEIDALRTERKDISAELEDVESKLRDYREKKQEKESLENDLSRFKDFIEGTETDIADLKEEVSELEEKQAALEPSPLHEEMIDKKSELQTKQGELSRLETKLEQTTQQLEEKTEQADSIEKLEEQKADVVEERQSLYNTIEDLETALVEQFNDEMNTVLELLAYENIARVRLERRVHESSGRGAETETEFDLTIARETDDGAVYEDQLENLSESERNVIGLVVALTGYLVHDVHEICPVMLFDSIEMIDGNRIDQLISRFSTYQEFLVAALLPGDADAIDQADATVIEW